MGWQVVQYPMSHLERLVEMGAATCAVAAVLEVKAPIAAGRATDFTLDHEAVS